MVAAAVLDGISAELGNSGADLGAQEDLPAEALPELAPEAPAEEQPAAE
jgi:hypothetical protein